MLRAISSFLRSYFFPVSRSGCVIGIDLDLIDAAPKRYAISSLSLLLLCAIIFDSGLQFNTLSFALFYGPAFSQTILTYFIWARVILTSSSSK